MRSLALLGSLLAIGCAGRATSLAEVGGASPVSGGSTGGAGAGGAAGAGRAGGGDAVSDASAGSATRDASADASCPPLLCPSPFFGLQLVVTSSGGSSLMGVEATLSGPVTIEFSCRLETAGTLCLPTAGGPEGSYSLEVTAPQFQSMIVDATVTFTPTQGCGCGGATLQPPAVVLHPMRL